MMRSPHPAVHVAHVTVRGAGRWVLRQALAESLRDSTDDVTARAYQLLQELQNAEMAGEARLVQQEAEYGFKLCVRRDARPALALGRSHSCMLRLPLARTRTLPWDLSSCICPLKTSRCRVLDRTCCHRRASG